MSLVYIPLSDSGQQISTDGLSDSVCICRRVQSLMCAVCAYTYTNCGEHVCVCVLYVPIALGVCVVTAVTGCGIRKLVKVSQRRK